jgi:hypothetical protein
VGIDERWREGVKVVFRKRSDGKQRHGNVARKASDFQLPLAT